MADPVPSFDERVARNRGVQDALNDLVDFLERELRKLAAAPGEPVHRHVVLRDVARWALTQRAMIATEDENLDAEARSPSPDHPKG